MTHKISSTVDNHSLNCYYLEHIFSPWFDIKHQDDFDIHETKILLTKFWKINDRVLQHLDRGGICIIDNLWERMLPSTLDKLLIYYDQIVVLNASEKTNFETISIPNWFWYNESLWYRSRNYHTYQPKIKLDRQHSFLMPIRRSEHCRDILVKKLDQLLENAIWSYVEKGRTLPKCPKDLEYDQRYFNPFWYDETWYSLVVETACDSGPCFVSEKTFKPLAYYHPFLIFGQKETLGRLRFNGFETFPEIFDESYDFESDLDRRTNKIIDQIKSFSPNSVNQIIVQEKLQHNHDRFFDRNLVVGRIQEELIKPLLDFLESK